MATTYSPHPTPTNAPVARALTARQFIHGGGVAIFHIKSARVVVVHHTREGHWFLPKGRKDVDESSVQGAEREGFEESGFRNRVLPLPHPTIQTRPPSLPNHPHPHPSTLLHTEPIATTLIPMGRRPPQIQYICSWYIAETLPPELQTPTNFPNPSNPPSSVIDSSNLAPPSNSVRPADSPPPYHPPPPSPRDETLAARMAREPDGWEPQRVERSTVQSDEVWYRAELMGVQEAVERLGGTGLEWIVREGWRAIQERGRLEGEWEREWEEKEGEKAAGKAEGKAEGKI